MKIDLKNSSTLFWLLVAILVITFIPFLGEQLYATKGEPREAIVAVSMLQQDNWILPESCGGDIPYKPPFFAWCIAALSMLFGGEVTEFLSRLPSALALIAMTLVGYRFYARRSTPKVAMLMAIISITAFEVFRAGYACRVDMVLTAFIVTALYALYRHHEKGAKGISILAILLMSGGMLTKGPVAILLPCLVIGVYRLLRGDGFWRAFLNLTLHAVLSLVIPAMWYVAAYLQSGDEFLQLVKEENLDRFTGKMSYESHENPIHYNFITVIAGLLPFTLLLLFSLFGLKYSKPGNPFSKGFVGRWREKLRTMDPAKLFSALSIILIFTFYCIPKSKRSVYLLPIYPFLAYFITLYIIYLAQRHARAIKVYGWVIASGTFLVAALLFGIKTGLIPVDFIGGKRAAENEAFVQALKDLPYSPVNILLFGLMLASGVYTIIACRRYCHIRVVVATLATTVIIYWNYAAYLQPAIMNTKSDKHFVETIERFVPEGNIYGHIETIMLRYYTINYYVGDRVKLFVKEQPQSGYLLIGAREKRAFVDSYANQYDFTEVYFSNRRSCDLRQPFYLMQFNRK